jgi:hypothetical protein
MVFAGSACPGLPPPAADLHRVGLPGVSGDRLGVPCLANCGVFNQATAATSSAMSRVRDGSTFTPGLIVVASVTVRR